MRKSLKRKMARGKMRRLIFFFFFQGLNRINGTGSQIEAHPGVFCGRNKKDGKDVSSNVYEEVRKLSNKDQNYIRKSKQEKLCLRRHEHKSGCQRRDREGFCDGPMVPSFPQELRMSKGSI